MNHSRSRNSPLPLPALLNRRLGTYAAAAGAVGASLFALSSAADAEIVYTPVNQTIGRDGSYSIDLNGDGIVDYILVEHAYKDGNYGTDQLLVLQAAMANQVVCPSTFCISGLSYADSMSAGSAIGPNIRPKGWIGRQVQMAFEETAEDGGVFFGYGWVNVTNRYVGLKFKINGEYHYGWARVSTHFNAGSGQERTWIARLTGYAYETVAGESIKAGQTQDDDGVSDASVETDPVRGANSLGLGTLALGVEGLGFWRREEMAGGGGPSRRISSEQE